MTDRTPGVERSFGDSAEAEIARLREIIEINSDWIWEVDADLRYVYSSARGGSYLGYTQEEILGKSPFDFMPPAEAERVGKGLEGTIAGRRAFSGVTNRVTRQDGGMVILETSGIPLFAEDGRFRGYRGIGRDVTAMSERSQQLESVYALAPLPLFVVDREHRFVEVNNAFAALCGAPVSEILDRKVAEFVPGAEESLRRDFATIDSGVDVADHEYLWNGREYMGSIRPLRNLAGKITGLSTAWLDITERNLASRSLSEANDRLERYAHEDYLTGLWNRRTLDDRLVTEVRRSHRSKRPVSVLMADVDFFKRYNDHYGHQAGDECLKAVSGIFRTTLHRAGDNAGRYGGEEFCAVLAETDLAGALSVAEALRAAVEALAIPHEGNPAGRVTISVGAAALDFSGPGKMEETSAKALVASADTALYTAKTAGRNTVR